VETLAELPFIGDQVVCFKPRPPVPGSRSARAQSTCQICEYYGVRTIRYYLGATDLTDSRTVNLYTWPTLTDDENSLKIGPYEEEREETIPENRDTDSFSFSFATLFLTKQSSSCWDSARNMSSMSLHFIAAVVPSQPRQFAVTIAVRSWWLSGLRKGRTH
jgi:hypothetical protein